MCLVKYINEKNKFFYFIDKNFNIIDFILVVYVYNIRIFFINIYCNKIVVICRYLCICV